VKFSLILCTVRRGREIAGFIESLLRTGYKNYELIIVDQNKDDRVLKVIEMYQGEIPSLKYLKVDFVGLSRARNVGLETISGDSDVVAFPDDDCEYPEDIFEKVAEKFRENPDIDFLTGLLVEKSTLREVGKWKRKNTRIKIHNVFKTGVSSTIFVKAHVIKSGLRFDERFGIGANTPYGSGEETDLVLKMLKMGYNGYFFRDIHVYHPYKEGDLERYEYYSAGMGAVLKRHFSWDIVYLFMCLNLLLIRPLGGITLSLLRGDINSVKKYMRILRGRWYGFLSYDERKVNEK